MPHHRPRGHVFTVSPVTSSMGTMSIGGQVTGFQQVTGGPQLLQRATQIGVSKAQAVGGDVGHLGEVANRCRALHLNMMTTTPASGQMAPQKPAVFVGDVDTGRSPTRADRAERHLPVGSMAGETCPRRLPETASCPPHAKNPTAPQRVPASHRRPCRCDRYEAEDRIRTIWRADLRQSSPRKRE